VEKKIGSSMPQIIKHNNLKSFSEICPKIKTRHFNKNKMLSIALSYQLKNNEYLIFQEIENFPFRTVIWNSENNSMAFSADWSFVKKPKIYNGSSLIEGEIDWEDIPTPNESVQSAVLNARTNPEGVFNRNGASFPLPGLKNKNTAKSWTTLRIEHINHVDIWDWGFSIRSPILNMVAYNFDKKSMYPGVGYDFQSRFPYFLKGEEERENSPRGFVDSRSRRDYDSLVYNKFNFAILSDSYRTVYNDDSGYGSNNNEFISTNRLLRIAATGHFDEPIEEDIEIVVDYWDAIKHCAADGNFDEEMDDLARGIKEKIEIQDVGQAMGKEILLD